MGKLRKLIDQQREYRRIRQQVKETLSEENHDFW